MNCCPDAACPFLQLQAVLLFKQSWNTFSVFWDTVFHLWPLLCFSYYPVQIRRERKKQTFTKFQEKQTNQTKSTNFMILS